MSLLSYPILLAIVIVTLILLTTMVFLNKYNLIFNIAILALITIYVINALLLGFDYLEIVVTLLLLGILYIIVLLIKGRFKR